MFRLVWTSPSQEKIVGLYSSFSKAVEGMKRFLASTVELFSEDDIHYAVIHGDSAVDITAAGEAYDMAALLGGLCFRIEAIEEEILTDKFSTDNV